MATNNFSWPGVYNPKWSWMDAPWNLGMGKSGYDISGQDPMSYYNSSGPWQSGGGSGANSSFMMPQGYDPFYGYGGLFGGSTSGPGSTMSGGPQLGGGGMQMTGQPAMWNPKTGPAGGPLGPPTSNGNVTYSPVGDQEKILDQIFKGSVGGGGGGPIANMLLNLGTGRLPNTVAQGIIADTNESFGKMGARFGTDLATAQARGLAQASEKQSLDAIQQILGLGGTTSSFQFQRGENALQRAMQEYLGQIQNDPITKVLGMLGGLGGGG